VHFELPNNVHVSEFVDLLSSFDLKQFVEDASHTAGGILDVIIARNNESVVNITVSESGISDHCLITGRLLIQTNRCDSIPIESRKWNNFSIDAFREDLLNSAMCDDLEWTKSASVDELFCVYNNELVVLLDKHAPRYVRKRKRRLMTPWFDDDCRRIKRKGRILERLYRKSHDPCDRLRWVKQLQEQARFYQDKERCYWSNRISANAANPRQLWNDLNELMKRDDDNPNELSSPLEAVKKADDFVQFFESKVHTVRNLTDNAQQPVYEQSTTQLKFISFQHITPMEVIKLIKSANNTYCLLDPIPTAIVKNCKDLLTCYVA
jgi:hypothetical protein